MLPFICHHLPFLSFLCESGFSLKKQIGGAVVGLVAGYIFKAFGTLAGLFRPKYWKLCGRWYRYGLGFYTSNSRRPLHQGTVFIVPIPPLTVVLSFNKTYSYIGNIRTQGSTLYVSWRGLLHSEQMLSVYAEPLKINESTRLLGVKSCITKYGEPAANKELLSKVPVSVEELYEILDGPGTYLVINRPVSFSADYEEQPTDDVSDLR